MPDRLGRTAERLQLVSPAAPCVEMLRHALVSLALACAPVAEAPSLPPPGPLYPTASSVRVPAEWEPQEAVWLQWPREAERSYEPGFARMVATMLRHEDVHLLVHDEATRRSATAALTEIGGLDESVAEGAASPEGFTLGWHAIANDNAWMRDNGPRYVIVDGALRIQNWAFDAWGGGFGRIPYRHDDAVPDALGALLGLPVDSVPIVHERGDLEFNGRDAVLLNWSVIGDPARNPGMTRQRAMAAMRDHFGVTRVVLLEGVPTGDGTRGHVDGIARFIDSERVVVADCSPESHCQPGDVDDRIYDAAAAAVSAAGFTVIRFPFPAAVTYRDATFDTDYMNWFVGNGFVLAVGFGDADADAQAEERLRGWFPDRDVYVIEMLESWYAGGGVHCHTNDQPRPPER